MFLYFIKFKERDALFRWLDIRCLPFCVLYCNANGTQWYTDTRAWLICGKFDYLYAYIYCSLKKTFNSSFINESKLQKISFYVSCICSPKHKLISEIIRFQDFLLAFQFSCFALLNCISHLKSCIRITFRIYLGNGRLRSVKLNNNAFKVSSIRKKNKVNITERQGNGN